MIILIIFIIILILITLIKITISWILTSHKFNNININNNVHNYIHNTMNSNINDITHNNGDGVGWWDGRGWDELG